ncbi:MAG TPA: class I SAM-dependent methyltransferase, partial [Bryobacteraceae bacterium]|nr:class I SAM-dependent methyltransferase [Bryobacteraceae bacterium]
PAVVAFREYLVARIRRAAGLRPSARVLSIGCGVGDTELLLAQSVAHVTGIDLSPAAVRQARYAAEAKRAGNVRFLEASWPTVRLDGETFDAVIAVFFLHHLPDDDLAAFPRQVFPLLRPGGPFYALEPSTRRLSGYVGKLLVPALMKKYQTEDERQLRPTSTAGLFRQAGFDSRTRWFDFCSTPLAGLFPSWRSGYRAARLLDGALTAAPGLRALSSNFELIARRPES